MVKPPVINITGADKVALVLSDFEEKKEALTVAVAEIADDIEATLNFIEKLEGDVKTQRQVAKKARTAISFLSNLTGEDSEDEQISEEI